MMDIIDQQWCSLNQVRSHLSDLDEFRFSHQEHAQSSLDVRALQLIQKVVKARHPLLPVVKLSPRAEVIGLLSQLVTLSKDLENREA